MDGVVTGGWEFVVAAYSVTAVVFVGYTASVLFRVRAGDRKSKEQK